MDDSQNEEYFESSFNFSSQNSDCNIDSLLKPPSDTDLELDLKDQEIKISLEKQEKFAREEHDNVVSKNFSKPSVIRPFPPGLHVFTDDTPLIFTLEDLSLEVHFQWTGRGRLVKTGQDEDHIERLLCSTATEENLIHFVRYLTPELIDNNMITTPEEYVSIVDYLFYCASMCQDDLVFSVLKKCLLDLLKSYSYEWTLTPTHLVTVFLNLGGDPTLMCNPDFYRSIEDLAIYPEEQTFLDSMKIPSSRSEPSMVLSVSRRNHHLCRILEICQDVLRVPGRMESYRGVDKKNWKTLIFLCSLVAQDRHCAPDPRIQRAAATLLHCLLDLVGSRPADILDVVEMVTNRWRPVQVAAAAASWSPGEVPAEMTELGHNHPHNMLALATLFPPAARHLQQLLAFVYIQMILRYNVNPIPSEFFLEPFVYGQPMGDGSARSATYVH